MKSILPILILFSANTYANLKAPIDLPSAALMPPKVRNLSFKQIFASATNKYNNSGDEVVVSDPLFTDISFQSIADSKKDPAEQAAIYQMLDAIGEDKNAVVAKTTGQVNIKANATVPVLAYGLSERWTVAVAVPVLKYATNVGSSVKHTNAALIKKVQAKLDNDKRVPQKGAELITKLATDPVGEKLNEYGYQSISNESGTKLGDVKLIAKFKAKQTTKNLFTLQSELTLPTGQQANIDKAVDVPGGDGQTDFGFFLLNDYSLNKNFTLSGKVGHTIQFKDTTAKRIPEVKTSTLSPDKDLNTQRNLGDMSVLELAVKFHYEGFGLATGYSLQYKDADKYSGDQYEESRYHWMSADTVQNMQTVQLKLSYDTISLFKQKKFAAPLMIDVNHTRVVAGKNVVNDPLTALNFSLFF